MIRRFVDACSPGRAKDKAAVNTQRFLLLRGALFAWRCAAPLSRLLACVIVFLTVRSKTSSLPDTLRDAVTSYSTVL